MLWCFCLRNYKFFWLHCCIWYHNTVNIGFSSINWIMLFIAFHHFWPILFLEFSASKLLLHLCLEITWNGCSPQFQLIIVLFNLTPFMGCNCRLSPHISCSYGGAIFADACLKGLDGFQILSNVHLFNQVLLNFFSLLLRWFMVILSFILMTAPSMFYHLPGSTDICGALLFIYFPLCCLVWTNAQLLCYHYDLVVHLSPQFVCESTACLFFECLCDEKEALASVTL